MTIIDLIKVFSLIQLENFGASQLSESLVQNFVAGFFLLLHMSYVRLAVAFANL